MDLSFQCENCKTHGWSGNQGYINIDRITRKLTFICSNCLGKDYNDIKNQQEILKNKKAALKAIIENSKKKFEGENWNVPVYQKTTSTRTNNKFQTRY